MKAEIIFLTKSWKFSPTSFPLYGMQGGGEKLRNFTKVKSMLKLKGKEKVKKNTVEEKETL